MRRIVLLFALVIGGACASGEGGEGPTSGPSSVGATVTTLAPITTLAPVTTTSTTTTVPAFTADFEAEVVAACSTVADAAGCECVVRAAAATMSEDRFRELLDAQASEAAVPELVELVEGCQRG